MRLSRLLNEHLHIPLVPLQDDHVFLYRVDGPNTHVVPRTVKEELGLDGPIDAAFMCEDNTTVVVKGSTSITSCLYSFTHPEGSHCAK